LFYWSRLSSTIVYIFHFFLPLLDRALTEYLKNLEDFD